MTGIDPMPFASRYGFHSVLDGLADVLMGLECLECLFGDGKWTMRICVAVIDKKVLSIADIIVGLAKVKVVSIERELAQWWCEGRCQWLASSNRVIAHCHIPRCIIIAIQIRQVSLFALAYRIQTHGSYTSRLGHPHENSKAHGSYHELGKGYGTAGTSSFATIIVNILLLAGVCSSRS